MKKQKNVRHFFEHKPSFEKENLVLSFVSNDNKHGTVALFDATFNQRPDAVVQLFPNHPEPGEI